MANSADRLIKRAYAGNNNRSDAREAYALLVLQLLSDAALVDDKPNYAAECIAKVRSYGNSEAATDFAQRFDSIATQLARGN